MLLPIRITSSLGSSFSLLVEEAISSVSSLSSFNYESCQYAKLHLVHLSLRFNKLVSAPFELVHSDV